MPEASSFLCARLLIQINLRLVFFGTQSFEDSMLHDTYRAVYSQLSANNSRESIRSNQTGVLYNA